MASPVSTATDAPRRSAGAWQQKISWNNVWHLVVNLLNPYPIMNQLMSLICLSKVPSLRSVPPSHAYCH